jgi:hypothetical protein
MRFISHNAVNPLEHFKDTEKSPNLSEPWKRKINTVKSYLLTAPCFFDWVDSLIGPSGLLLVVSHLSAIPVSVLWVGLEKSQ